MTCSQRSTWMELWQAMGMLDKAAQQLAFKLRFDTGPKNVVTECFAPNRPMPHQYLTGAWTRSDSVSTPLDNLVTAAKDGEKVKFEFPVPPVAKTFIEIKL